MFSPTLLTSASALCIPFLLLATTDSDKASGAAGSGSPSHTLLTTGVGVGTGGESPLGTNLAPLSHYSTQIAFKDLFEQASRWYPQETTSYTWDTGQPIDLDADGWVRSLATDQAAGVLLARNLQGHYPAGEYTIRYQGTGVLEVHLDGAVSASQPGEMTVDVNPSDAGIHLKLVETDALDPMRNIQVLLPGFANDPLTEPFHPDFIALLRPFATIRLMGWQRTNEQSQRDWSDRVQPRDSRQTSDEGVALEYMIDLCNQADVDPWFCMPHEATDDYVTQFATLVRNRLEPQLQPHIEYSNEVWNAIYPQGWYAQQQGVSLGLSTNAYQAQLRFYSQRSVEIFDIWNVVYGAANDPLVPVLAGQSVNQWSANQVLSWRSAFKKAEVYAVNAYFGRNLGLPDTMGDVQDWSLDQVFDALYDYIDDVTVDTYANHRIAERAGLQLYSYEAGQHLVGVNNAVYNDQLTELFISANKDSRMSALYSYALTRWREAGGTRYMHWNLLERYTRWGSWGSMEFMDDGAAGAPKYGALARFAQNNPVWW